MCINAIHSATENYFTIPKNPPAPLWVTALKIVSYATLIIPALALILRTILRLCPQKISSSNPPLSPQMQQALAKAPVFNGYQIGFGTTYAGVDLREVSLRPANLFFHALLGPNSTTLPGSNQLFALTLPHQQIRNQIQGADPNGVIAFSAQGIAGHLRGREIPDLSAIYGNATYRISNKELQDTLASQKIYLASSLPLPFYQVFKRALLQNGIVTLDQGHGIPNGAHLIQAIRQNPGAYGFTCQQHCEEILLGLTPYQLGALVVKSEDFRIFIDLNGKIIERTPGTHDAIRLINACGIRDFHTTSAKTNKEIMTETFKASMVAAESGIMVVPAVGMGVWGGDPDVYWRAFLEAVVAKGDALEQILVNPGHQLPRSGRYVGRNGDEFQEILNEYRARYAGKELQNLNKVINLYHEKKDLVHLSFELRKTFPNKIISLLNASDPDVTLGNHVGEYVNSISRGTTTEENYTAMGTNGLCFETITGVHNDPARVIQVR